MACNYREYGNASMQFFHAGTSLVEAMDVKGRCLFRPTLFVVGQGLELLLKGCMAMNGKRFPDHGAEGHRIKTLWHDTACAFVRERYLVNAEMTRLEALEIRKYKGIPKNKDDKTALKNVNDLMDLHANRATLYPVSQDRMGPRVPWLAVSLAHTGHDFFANPRAFKIDGMAA